MNLIISILPPHSLKQCRGKQAIQIKSIAKKIGVDSIAIEYQNADTSHCLTMEQNIGEFIKYNSITKGTYNPTKNLPPTCTITTVTQIGKNYAYMV